MHRHADLEMLESRRLMTYGFTDVQYGSGGATTLSFRTSANEKVVSTQLAVAAGGESYVMAVTAGTAQVRKLTAAGLVDTTWVPKKRNLLVFPTTVDGKQVRVDAASRLLVLADNTLYRFTAAGDLDQAFGDKGLIKLSDFAGATSVSVDATNKIYVTGPTTVPSATIPKAGVGMLVERFISRGKLDKTFGGDGRVSVALPKAAARPYASAQAAQVVALPDKTPRTAGDDKVLLAGAVYVPGLGTGVQATRLNYDGSLDATYGHGGSAYAAGTATTSDTQPAAFDRYVLRDVVANGVVSLSHVGVDEENHPSSDDPRYLSANRGALLSAPYVVTSATRTFDDGYIGIVPDTGVVRFKADNTVETYFNGHRPPLTGISAIEVASIRFGNDVLASSVRTDGRVTVTLFSSGIDPAVGDNDSPAQS